MVQQSSLFPQRDRAGGRRQRGLQPLNSDLLNRLQSGTSTAQRARQIRLAREGQQIAQDSIAGLAAEQDAQAARAMEESQVLARLNQALPVAPEQAVNEPQGLLPRLATLPGIEQILGGFQAFQENIIEPGATLSGSTLGQRLPIPSLRDLQQGFQAGSAEARAQGAGALEQLGAGLEAGGDVPLPSTSVPLLPTPVNLPESIFGPDKTFQRVDLGQRGLLELAVATPFDLALGAGIGKATRAGLQAASKTAAGRRALPPAREPLKLADDVTIESESPLGRTVSMYETPLQKPRGPIREQISLRYRQAQEALTDKFAGANAATTRARKDWRDRFGFEMPEDKQFELQASLVPGAYSAGADRAKVVVSAARKSLGSDINESALNAYLSLRHQFDVLANHPDRAVPAGLRGRGEVEAGLSELEARLGTERFARLQGAAEHVRKFYDDQLQRRVDEGLMSRDLAGKLRTDYPWYNPIRYEQEVAEHFQTGGGRVLSVTQNDIRRLSELGSEAAQVEPLQAIAQSAIQTEVLIARNRASRAMVQTLLHDPQTASQVRKVSGVRPVAQVDEQAVFRRPKGEIRGTVSFMRGGQRAVYEVPDWAESEAKGLATLQLGGLQQLGRGLNAPLRMALVEYNPAFIATNFMRDMFQSWAVMGIWPWETAQGALTALRSVVLGPDDTMRQMIRAGGDVSGFWGRRPEEWASVVKKGGNIALPNENDWSQYFGKTLRRPWETVRDIGHALELGPRVAAFRRELGAGRSVERAAQTARRVTIDFDRAGNAVRAANNFFMFLNPAVQGTTLPVRALRDWSRARAFMPGLLGMKLGEYMWNRQFEEYYDIPIWDRYGKVNVMLPSEEFDRNGNKVPHYISVVPGLHALSAIMAPFEYALAKLDGEAPESFKEVMLAAAANGNPLAPAGVSLTGEPGLALTPSFAKPFVEIGINRDTFRDREIVPLDLAGLPPEEQFNEFTSLTARRLGDFFSFSPMKIDHLMRSGVFQDIATSADAVIRMTEEDTDPRADAVLAFLEDMQETTPPEDISRFRRLVLNSLEPDLRTKVEELERRPQPEIPFAANVATRFYRKYGGQVYQSGLERAAGEAGVSADHIRTIQHALGELSDELYDQEWAMDTAYRSGEVTGGQWAGAYAEMGGMYQMALKGLGTLMPSAAEILSDPTKRAAFYEDVNTVVGELDDQRTKGEFLMAAFNSIPIPEAAPGVKDWGAWFDLRDEFLNGLPEGDRNLLRSEQEAGMTPARREYVRQRELARPYYEVHKRILQGHPERIAIYEDFRRLSGPNRERALLRHPWLADVEGVEAQARQALRMGSPEIDRFIFSYNDSIAAPLHPRNQGPERRIEMRPWEAMLRPELVGSTG